MSTLTPAHSEIVARRPTAAHTSSTAFHTVTLLALWLVIFGASLTLPPLLDDADATHAQAAQAMLRTGDWVTLHVDGVRYLEKAPLPYWLAAYSLRLFGQNAFAIHLPLALAVLGLAALGYSWARRSFGAQTAFYTALFMLTSIGPFLFTRIFIPEALLSLLLACGLCCFDRVINVVGPDPGSRTRTGSEVWIPALLFWVCMALAVLTKGLVAIIFLLGAAALYLTLTRTWDRWRALQPFAGTLLFLVIAAPWHVLACLRNTGGADGHGFFWFYFVNEHVLRFLGRRVPRDYNKLPALLYWLLHFAWLFPWSLFAPAAALTFWRNRRQVLAADTPGRRTCLLLLCFSALLLVFFSLSTNQEYYTFPAYLPLLMLIALSVSREDKFLPSKAFRMGIVAFAAVGLIISVLLLQGLAASRHLSAHTDIGTLLAHRNVGGYTLSLSHFLDLTNASMAALRLPASLACIALLAGPAIVLVLLRKHASVTSVVSTIAWTSSLFLVAAHIALDRYAPLLSSADFAQRILTLQDQRQIGPDAQIAIYGDQAFGSSIPFYLQHPVLLVDGRSSSMLFGSTFPDAPPVFITSADLNAGWGHGPRKLLFVPAEQHEAAINLFGSHAILLFQSSGKELLTDRPLDPPETTRKTEGSSAR